MNIKESIRKTKNIDYEKLSEISDLAKNQLVKKLLEVNKEEKNALFHKIKNYIYFKSH